ncbi:MAG: hypothetical protein M8350_03820 [Methanosarcinaceae archaeon]|nr:hypothetical protein [Methanosarcinaceae archaeon]
MNRNDILLGLENDQLAQMHTLEAIMASTIMVMIIVFAVQATSLTPLTSSTANAHIEAQLQVIGQDMLSALDYSQYDQRSDLKNDILNWNGNEYVWNGTSYYSDTPNASSTLNSSITDMLTYIAIPRGIAHNVQFTHMSDTGRFSSIFYIYNGDPSDNAVIISRKVVLSNPDIGNTSTFQANTGIVDIDDTTDLYNIINVKLILWRM